MRKILLALVLLAIPNLANAQWPSARTTNTGHIGIDTAVPSACTKGDVFVDTTTSILRLCVTTGAPGTWVTLALATNNLSFFASTTSAQLATLLSDETGSGLAVFGTSPTLTTPTISGAVSFPDGTRQTFNPDGTTPGLNVGSQAGDPSTPINADTWYNSTTNKFRCRENSVTVDCIGGTTVNAVFVGYCNGVASASQSAIRLAGIGNTNNASGNALCTQVGATTLIEVPLGSAGTLKNLRVNLVTAGVNASSGVFTVYKNGVATAITCTTGTALTCNDSSNTVSVSAGDSFTVLFSTQAGETLASPTVTLEKGP